jgi:FMN phosphatase YigB (HAD superfamily)
MVGDSWSRDIEGAIAAGLQAVWVARARSRPAWPSQVGIVEKLDADAFAGF